jgi:DNA repair protein RecO (recombination protein O)
MNRSTTTAIVLQRRQYGDFDLIVTVLSRDQGKRTLIAKSAKKSTKRFPGILEPFNHLHIAYRETRRKGLPILEEATLYRTMGRMRSDFLKTAYASYWVECINIWIEEGREQAALYHLLEFVLNVLEAGEMDPAFLSILFQMRFIGYEGLHPVLEHCSSCRSDISAMAQNRFCVDLGKGGVVCQQCPAGAEQGRLHLSKDTLKQLQWIADGDLAKARRIRFSSRTLIEATTFLEAFVPYHISKKPKSLRVLQEMRKG